MSGKREAQYHIDSKTLEEHPIHKPADTEPLERTYSSIHAILRFVQVSQHEK